MRPFLVTGPQAGKLPRWGLLLLCALYLLPGFIGRDPWRQADASGFGLALTMARGAGADWLMPNIAGERVPDAGPLPFWLGAAAARLVPSITEHTMVRAASITIVLAGFVAIWYGVYALARRPGVLPRDPFEAGASRIDFGRAIADSALLVLLATLGLVAAVHETTDDAAQVAVCALFLWASASVLQRPLTGGLLAGLSIGLSVITGGLAPAVALLLTALLLPAASPAFRLRARRWLPPVLGAGLVTAAAWPLALMSAGAPGQAHLAAWLAASAARLGPWDGSVALYWTRTLPWFFWPAWPIALWALLRWRGRLGEPAIALPLVNLGTCALALLACPHEAGAMLPLTLPLAMLAALGLPTLRRSLVSLIDWFAVMSFSVIGLLVWAWWLALLLGQPERMAYRASLIAPGFAPGEHRFDLLLGVLASIGWVLLVRWRISRQPPMIWRAVVLSAGGLVFAWFLLMTLWLPAFNQRNTYREVSQRIAGAMPPGDDCVNTRGLDRAQRASLLYFGGLRFGGPQQRCGWLLVQDQGMAARAPAGVEPGWQLRAEAARPRDRDERLRLYRRID